VTSGTQSENSSRRSSLETKLFGDAAFYLGIIDAIAPVALRHTYHFMRDDVFAKWRDSENFNWKEFNRIVSLELIDKAHLAAMTALIRTKRWASAVCLMEEAHNLIGWATACRGLLESSGDVVDGLLNIRTRHRFSPPGHFAMSFR